MNRLSIFCLLVLFTPLTLAQKNGDDPDRGLMTVWVGGFDLANIISPDGQTRTLEELQRNFLVIAGLRREELSGQALLVFNSLASILEEAGSVLPEEPDPKTTHPRCLKAYVDKRAWHILNGGKVPYAFGKIVDYDLTEYPKTSSWTGAIDLCTWVGAVNYYFEIEFVEAGANSLTLIQRPFPPALLDPALFPLADFSLRFEFKLHGEKGAIQYRKIFENNVLLGPGHPFYANLEQKCFDMFYKFRPDGTQANDLKDQHSYCMGRCDLKVVNTGR